MAAERPAEADTVAYRGEVWTDGRGFATVRLPAGADVVEAPVEYELRDIDPSSSARVSAKLERGRFTIATEQPHVKVAWRITARRSKSSDGSRPSTQRRV